MGKSFGEKLDPEIPLPDSKSLGNCPSLTPEEIWGGDFRKAESVNTTPEERGVRNQMLRHS